ncbi:MAG: hypothetical protein ACOX87_08680 [Chloroflexota bacterium]
MVGLVREPRAEAAGLKRLSPFGATVLARRASSSQRGRFSAALSAPSIDLTNFGTVLSAAGEAFQARFMINL